MKTRSVKAHRGQAWNCHFKSQAWARETSFYVGLLSLFRAGNSLLSTPKQDWPFPRCPHPRLGLSSLSPPSTQLNTCGRPAPLRCHLGSPDPYHLISSRTLCPFPSLSPPVSLGPTCSGLACLRNPQNSCAFTPSSEHWLEIFGLSAYFYSCDMVSLPAELLFPPSHTEFLSVCNSLL